MWQALELDTSVTQTNKVYVLVELTLEEGRQWILQ